MKHVLQNVKFLYICPKIIFSLFWVGLLDLMERGDGHHVSSETSARSWMLKGCPQNYLNLLHKNILLHSISLAVCWAAGADPLAPGSRGEPLLAEEERRGREWHKHGTEASNIPKILSRQQLSRTCHAQAPKAKRWRRNSGVKEIFWLFGAQHPAALYFMRILLRHCKNCNCQFPYLCRFQL